MYHLYNDYHQTIHEIDHMADLHVDSSFYKQSVKIDNNHKIKEWFDSSKGQPVSGQKPPRHKPPDKSPPCQKPLRQKPPRENLRTQNIFYINKFLPWSCFILLDQLTYD